VPDRLKAPLAVLSSVGAVVGGVAVTNTLSATPAVAQETTDSSAAPETCQAPSDLSKPYDACWNTDNASNLNTSVCQGRAMDELIISRKLTTSRKSRGITLTEKTRRLDDWNGMGWLYACSLLTKNTVTLQVVSNKTHKLHPKVEQLKKIGKPVIIKTDESTNFPGTLNPQPSLYKHRFLKSRKISRHDRKIHKYGVVDVTVSLPLMQRPYIDPYNYDSSVPGPLLPSTSEPHILMIK
jgi:hypothetical protein